MKKFILILSSILIHSATAFSVEEFTLLETRRPELILPHFSVAEKTALLDQVQLALGELFVHRDLKMRDFGPQTDPVPQISELRGELETISDLDFHSRIVDIHKALRDFHTSYSLPAPYQCYTSFLPFSLKRISAQDGREIIVVSAANPRPEVAALFPQISEIHVGDQLMTYDHEEPLTAASRLAPQSQGANPDAFLNTELFLMTIQSQRRMIAPVKDQIAVTLVNQQGAVIELNVPWISRVNSIECLNQAKTEIKFKRTRKKDKFRLGELKNNDSHQMEFKSLFGEEPASFIDTTEPIIKYKKIQNEFGSFGVIQLASFSPEKLSVSASIEIIRRLLINEFAQTDGLIFDLRGNPGGQISFAEKMVQLFSVNRITPLKFTLKNSAANLFFLEHARPDDDFLPALRTAISKGSAYTEPLNFYTSDEASSLGQFYYKPVAVFTDSNCYSSCDMFSSQMQDSGAAIIIGVDSTTGAGGANNMQFNGMREVLPDGQKGPFTALGHGQDLGFAWRQTLRTGPNQGQYLEDRGVISDMIIRPELSDLLFQSQSQYLKISRKLAELRPTRPSWVNLSSVRQDILQGQPFNLNLAWTKLSSVAWNMANGNSIGEVSVEENNDAGRLVTAPAQINTQSLQMGRIELIGHYNGLTVWRKIASYRVVPPTRILETDEAVQSDFSQPDVNPLALYSNTPLSEAGWTVKDQALKTSVSANYPNGLHTEAGLFVDLSKKTSARLSFSLKGRTEQDYDFFKVVVKVDGVEKNLIEPLSGEISPRNFDLDLSAYAGKSIEISFVFDSDEGITDSGLELDNLLLK